MKEFIITLRNVIDFAKENDLKEVVLKEISKQDAHYGEIH